MEGRDSNNSSDVKAEVPFDSSENTGMSSVIVNDEMLPDVVKSESNENTPDVNAESDGNHPEYTDCTATQLCFGGIKTEMPDDYESHFESESLESKYLSEEHSTNLKHKISVSDECVEETEPTNHSSPGVDVKIEIEEDMDKCESDLESYEEGLVKIDSNGSMDSNSEPNVSNERGHSSQEFIRGIDCQEYPILCVKDEGKMEKQFDYIAEIDTAFQESSRESRAFTKPTARDLDCIQNDIDASDSRRDGFVPLTADHSVYFTGSADQANCTGEGVRQSHDKGSESKLFRCTICGKSLTRKFILKKHMVIHTGEKQFKCEVCGATFFEKGNLKTHRHVHDGIKPFKCETCGASFSHKSNFNAHNRIHDGIKPFQCDICGASFTEKNNLKAHIRLHAGIKPFKCETCGATFSRRNSLRRHMLIHSGDKPFMCDICGAAFIESGNLKRHMRSHSGV